MGIYLSTLKHFVETKKKLTEHLKALTKKERYAIVFELFVSAPGFGWYTAIRLVLEWGTDIAQRFIKSEKKIASFTGLTSSKKKAIVAVTRKLAVRLRALVVTDTPYQIGVAR